MQAQYILVIFTEQMEKKKKEYDIVLFTTNNNQSNVIDGRFPPSLHWMIRVDWSPNVLCKRMKSKL